jgi:hypothetical protein
MCIGGSAPPPKLQEGSLPASSERPADEQARTAENPWATDDQKRLENETEERMLYRWDEDVNQYRSITGAVIADSSRDIWVDPGGMDLPTWQAPGTEQEVRTNK